jgi:hypothetical protein
MHGVVAPKNGRPNNQHNDTHHNDSQHNGSVVVLSVISFMPSVVYAEYHKIGLTPRVVILSVILLSVVMLSVIMLCVSLY